MLARYPGYRGDFLWHIGGRKKSQGLPGIPGRSWKGAGEGPLEVPRGVEKLAALVVVSSGGNDGDVHTTRAVDLVDVDLVELWLLLLLVLDLVDTEDDFLLF